MLSSEQDPKRFLEWIERDYVAKASALVWWRKHILRALGLVLVGAGTVLGVLLFLGLPRSLAVHLAGPVAPGHVMIGCEQCHTGTMRTWARFWSQNDSLRSVTDCDCLACHQDPIHQPQQLTTPGCATCHREHQGQPLLARVDDTHCTACHQSLGTKDGTTRFQTCITSFPGDHPPFGRWRGPAGLTDEGTIRFNHQAHLQEHLLGPDRKPVTLACTACHQPDAAGRHLLPIRYEQHCASCHALSVRLLDEGADEPARKAATRFRQEPAPHPRRGESARQVRDALRGRLLAFAREANVLGTRKVDEPERPLFGRRRGPPMVENELAWVNGQLQEIERVLFDGAGGCAYCHRETTEPLRRPDGLPAYAPPRLTDRWFPYSRFSHARHGTMACLDCHEKADRSTATSEVLLPAIGQCSTCHTPTGGARADCVECHNYHDRSQRRGLNALLAPSGFAGKPN